MERMKYVNIEIFKALCASFFNLQSSIAKRLGGRFSFSRKSKNIVTVFVRVEKASKCEILSFWAERNFFLVRK